MCGGKVRFGACRDCDVEAEPGECCPGFAVEVDGPRVTEIHSETCPVLAHHRAIAGLCSHGGHDWDGDTCDEII